MRQLTVKLLELAAISAASSGLVLALAGALLREPGAIDCGVALLFAGFIVGSLAGMNDSGERL